MMNSKGILKRLETVEKELGKKNKGIPVLFVTSEAEIEKYRQQIGEDTVIIIDDIGVDEDTVIFIKDADRIRKAIEED